MEDREIKDWFYRKRAEALIARLEKRRFQARYVSTGDEARETVLSLIPEGAVVALTGSQTLEQIGVKPYLRGSDKYRVLDPFEPGIDQDEGMARRKRGLTADVMVSSANALTENGILVNVDGRGNRVAGMIFGPDKVILAVGMNKVVRDVPAAMERLRQVAGPMNNRRYGLPNPCTETGYCADCAGPARICNYYTIIEYSMFPDRIHIVLIGQDLGY